MEEKSISKPVRVATDIRERTVRYAVRGIELYRFVQGGKDGAGRIIAKQYLRRPLPLERMLKRHIPARAVRISYTNSGLRKKKPGNVHIGCE